MTLPKNHFGRKGVHKNVGTEKTKGYFKYIHRHHIILSHIRTIYQKLILFGVSRFPKKFTTYTDAFKTVKLIN